MPLLIITIAFVNTVFAQSLLAQPKYPSNCNALVVEDYLAKKACYLNGDSASCLILDSLTQEEDSSASAVGLGGAVTAGILSTQSKSAQQKYKELLQQVRSERTYLREAHKIKVEIDRAVAKEVTQGKADSRFSLSGEERIKADKLYEQKLAQAEKSQIKLGVKNYLSPESSLSIYKSRTGLSLQRLYTAELERLKPYYDDLEKARADLAEARQRKMTDLTPYNNNVAVKRKALGDLISRSPELKIVNSLKYAVGYTAVGQNDVFKIASKLSREIDGKRKTQTIKNGVRAGGVGVLASATMAVAESHLDKSAIEGCKKELGLSDLEVEILKSEFKPLAAQVSGSGRFDRNCSKLVLLDAEQVFESFGGELPQGVCNIVQNELKQFDKLSELKLSNVKANCQEIKSDRVNIRSNPPAAELSTTDGVTVKANLDADHGWPNFRTATYFRGGKVDKILTEKCTSRYNFRHPPTATYTDQDKLDIYAGANDSCIPVAESIAARKIYQTSHALCADATFDKNNKAGGKREQ